MLARQFTPFTPSTITATPADADPDRAAAVFDAAESMVARLLSEIAKRWPGQASGWAADPAYRMAWSRALAEQAPRAPSWERLARALGALSARPYPPSVGALIEAATEPPVSAPEARRTLLVALAAAGRGEWHVIPDAPWQAGCSVGWDRLRQMPAHDDRAFGAWRAALAEAIEQPDREVIERRPARPAALLPPSDSVLAARATTARAELREMHRMLGMPLPPSLREEVSP